MIHKNYNRFKEAAFGGVFRNDGRLLLAGSEESALKLFDVSSKNLLRVFKGHQRFVVIECN
jgi:U3 small nucleolar RNA-associated protein 15